MNVITAIATDDSGDSLMAELEAIEWEAYAKKLTLLHLAKTEILVKVRETLKGTDQVLTVLRAFSKQQENLTREDNAYYLRSLR